MGKSKKDRMNFRKTLLDAPIKPRKLTVRNNKYSLEPIKTPIPEPLVPTPYVPPTPKPKQRIQKQAPVALPRNRLRQNRLPINES